MKQVQYTQERSQSVDDMQRRLEKSGHRVGQKLFELLCWREKLGKGDGKRFIRLIDLLTFISSTAWKALFGKAADSLEKSTGADDEYMIIEVRYPPLFVRVLRFGAVPEISAVPPV